MEYMIKPYGPVILCKKLENLFHLWDILWINLILGYYSQLIREKLGSSSLKFTYCNFFNLFNLKHLLVWNYSHLFFIYLSFLKFNSIYVSKSDIWKSIKNILIVELSNELDNFQLINKEERKKKETECSKMKK